MRSNSCSPKRFSPASGNSSSATGVSPLSTLSRCATRRFVVKWLFTDPNRVIDVRMQLSISVEVIDEGLLTRASQSATSGPKASRSWSCTLNHGSRAYLPKPKASVSDRSSFGVVAAGVSGLGNLSTSSALSERVSVWRSALSKQLATSELTWKSLASTPVDLVSARLLTMLTVGLLVLSGVLSSTSTTTLEGSSPTRTGSKIVPRASALSLST